MNPLNLAIFASHSGSNMQAIIDSIDQKKLNATIKCLITNNSNSYAIQRAINHNIPYFHISSKTHPNPGELVHKIIKILTESDVNIIILAGYMKLLDEEIIDYVEGRVLNIHPALLPKFGGEGMWGMNVHNAVINSNEKKSGATVHLVSKEYDKGRILGQSYVNITENDTAETLANKVLKLEHKLYSDVLIKISKGEIIIP